MVKVPEGGYRANVYEEDDLIKAAETIKNAILDQGRSPLYHQMQIERLHKEWPVLHKALFHLLDVMGGLEANGRANQSEHDGYSNQT